RTASFPITFTALSSGVRDVWVYAEGLAGNSGWKKFGAFTYVPPTAPQIVSATPSSGIGSSVNFTFHFSDTVGASALNAVEVWFATSDVNAPTCRLTYFKQLNEVHLSGMPPSGIATATGGPLGTTLQNAQCSTVS